MLFSNDAILCVSLCLLLYKLQCTLLHCERYLWSGTRKYYFSECWANISRTVRTLRNPAVSITLSKHDSFRLFLASRHPNEFAMKQQNFYELGLGDYLEADCGWCWLWLLTKHQRSVSQRLEYWRGRWLPYTEYISLRFVFSASLIPNPILTAQFLNDFPKRTPFQQSLSPVTSQTRVRSSSLSVIHLRNRTNSSCRRLTRWLHRQSYV